MVCFSRNKFILTFLSFFFSVTKLFIVEIPIKLLNIVLLSSPTEFLTDRYLGDKFLWKKNAITSIIGIGNMDIEATRGDM